MTDLATTRRRWLLPLVFFELYLTISVALFFWGPWPWDPADPLLLLAYLAAAQVVIAIGYLLSWPGVHALAQAPPDVEASDARALAFIRLSVIATFVLLIPSSLSRTGQVLPDVIEGILNSGAVYNANFERLEAGNPFVVVEYARMLLSPLLIGLLPLAVVYWSRMPKGLKVASAVGIAFHLSLFIATGTNKGIADFAATLPWLVFLGVAMGTLRLAVSRRTLVIAFLAIFIGFLAFFGAGQTQREGGVGEQGVFNTGADIIEADRESGISVYMSEDVRVVYESLARYVGQGYYALSMTFDLDHESTLGFGHSMFLARNADSLAGTDRFTKGSLPGILEEKTDWSMQGLWHSIYPWLASDVGFTGALLMVGFFAFLLGRSWGAALLRGGHWPVIMCYLMLVMFFYIPANNQIFQTAESCMGFFLTLTCWIGSSLLKEGRGRAGAEEVAGDAADEPGVSSS